MHLGHMDTAKKEKGGSSILYVHHPVQLHSRCLFSFQMRAEAHGEAAACSQAGNTRTSPSRPAGLSREQAVEESLGSNSSELAQPSHYLYVPNNAGKHTHKALMFERNG